MAKSIRLVNVDKIITSSNKEVDLNNIQGDTGLSNVMKIEISSNDLYFFTRPITMNTVTTSLLNPAQAIVKGEYSIDGGAWTQFSTGGNNASFTINETALVDEMSAAANYSEEKVISVRMTDDIGNVNYKQITISMIFINQLSVEYLVIAGGGGSGGGWLSISGGGGAGGYRSSSTINGEVSGGNSTLESPVDCDKGTVYRVAIGNGGGGWNGDVGSTSVAGGSKGGNSIFGPITSIGGGAGGGLAGWGVGGDGGSVGGGSGNYNGVAGNPVANQGFSGGRGAGDSSCGGGGGGAGAAGSAGQNYGDAGSGGGGLYSAITGANIARAGGGGSCGSGNSRSGGTGGGGAGAHGGTGGSGAVNTGSGGGAGKWGGSGGKGIVIISYPDYYPSLKAIDITHVCKGATTVSGTTTPPAPSTARAGYKTYEFLDGDGNIQW